MYLKFIKLSKTRTQNIFFVLVTLLGFRNDKINTFGQSYITVRTYRMEYSENIDIKN